MWDLDREQPALAAPRPPRAVPPRPGPSAGTVAPRATRPEPAAGRQCRTLPAARCGSSSPGTAEPDPGPWPARPLRPWASPPPARWTGPRCAGPTAWSATRRRPPPSRPSPAGSRSRPSGDQVLAVTGAPSALSIESAPDERRRNLAPRRADGHPVRAARRRNAHPRRSAERLPQLPRGPRRRGCGPRCWAAAPRTRCPGSVPAPLAARQVLAAGGESESGVVGAPELQPDYPGTGVTVLDVVPGPRADWFDQAALDSFAAQDWEVKAQSNRVGMRLDGTPLQRTRQGELASEGTVAGRPAGPAGRPARALPCRPPHHRRLPGDRRGGRLPARPRRPGPHRRQDPLPLG